MKKVLLICVVFTIVVGLILAGCAPAPKPAPAPIPAPAPAPAPVQVIKLLYTDHNPPNAWGSVHGTEPWFKQVEQATKGRVKVEPYYSETLAKGVDAWKAIKTGVADIAWAFHGYWPGMTPLADVVSLPGLPFKSARQCGGILWKLREKYPDVQKEFADVQVLMNYATSPYFLVTTKKQVKTVEDVQGMKIRVIGGPPVDQMKALGGAPVLMGMNDVYTSMQTGVLDGMAAPWGAIQPYKFYEVVKYYTFVPLFMGYFSFAMSKDKFNSMPPDIQNQIMSVSGYEGSRLYSYNWFDTVRDQTYEDMKKGGYKVEEYTPPPQELQRFTDIGGKPIWEAWVKKNEAEGRPKAREILNATLELINTEKE